MRGLLLGLAVAVAALTGSAAAQGDYRRQVMGYLEHGLERHAALGYARDRTIPDLTAPLELDRPYLWSIYLLEGRTYRVYGACDDDCGDLDMEIYGADGHFIERDVARDDTPYVQLTPTQTGRHYVRLWLYECRAEPCYVAARVVAGGRPSERTAEEAR
ncbi:MAG TPA: hypothetical protein VEA80_11945 [Vitreimonas sp.]|uniref:hypothetical protein n=1 Tax=Vitreimonas sp. TaxID=3069702 RepID=UPI002D5012E8|nr:hypothetical protein [Vitreimonas sp.]HYD88182.1 hypothetical protein [Vitreimonas sp.]